MIRVVSGFNLDAPTAIFEVREVILDAVEASPDPNVNDYALVVTRDPLGITPLELSSVPVAADDIITIAGYGAGALTSGTRQEAEVVVDMVTDDFFATGAGSPNACRGDAPALDASGALAGLAVFTIGAGCPPDGVFFRDLATYREEIVAWIAEADSDAGVDPDAGASDVGAPDAGAIDAALDAASSGGGGCSASGSNGTFGLLALMLFVRRRR